VPTSGLAAYVVTKAAGSPGQISLSLQITNTTAQSVDMSTVTLRYWYQDEGLGTAGLVFEVDYASVGDSNAIKDKVQGKVVAASTPVAGADHYLEVSFTAATLSAKGAAGNNDQLKFNGRLHNSGFQGTVDVTNDYSYDSGATGIDSKITLYQSGKLISGVEP
jgi:cellulose 1,4-beta-cellobiosidase